MLSWQKQKKVAKSVKKKRTRKKDTEVRIKKENIPGEVMEAEWMSAERREKVKPEIEDGLRGWEFS